MIADPVVVVVVVVLPSLLYFLKLEKLNSFSVAAVHQRILKTMRRPNVGAVSFAVVDVVAGDIHSMS